MAPMRKLWSSLLCGMGTDSPGPPSPSSAPEPPSPDQHHPLPSPPHELPQLAFDPPLELPTEPVVDPPAPTPPLLPPPVAAPDQVEAGSSLPPSRLAQLRRLETPSISHSLTPPTPIDAPVVSASSSTLSSSSRTRPSTPPSSHSHSREPSFPEQNLSSPHLLPPPSPNLTPNPHPSSPHYNRRGHHRRSSSTGSRSFRETLNAYAVEGENGQRSVNQYVLGETLGKGSYATVERAVDRETGLEYAIKEFSKRRLRQIAAAEAQRRERLAARANGAGRGKGRGRGRGRGGMTPGGLGRFGVADEAELDSGPDNLDLVRTEVAIMKKVDHPNLASVHEVIDVTSDDALLIMELCEGGPIFKLRDGDQVTPYLEEEARNIFRQLVLGIAYLHHNEIIHRDIKPDNALFADPSRTHVKLVDFGVSKFAASQHPVGLKSEPVAMSVAGSPAYMAPELLGGAEAVNSEETSAGYACDVWSLGVTLYALVVGRLPFTASDPSEMFRTIREETPDYPPNLSQPLLHLLTKLLDKSPLARATIPALWTDSWLTSSGLDPLPPFEDNVASPIAEPSGEEVDRALAVYRGSAFLALSAAAKFKGLLTAAATRRASAAGTGTMSTDDSPTGSPLTGPVVVDSPEMVASPVVSPSLVPSSSAANGNGLLPSSAIPAGEGAGGSASPTPTPPRGRSPARPPRQAPPRQQVLRERRATRMDTMSSLSLGEAGSRWVSRDDEFREGGEGEGDGEGMGGVEEGVGAIVVDEPEEEEDGVRMEVDSPVSVRGGEGGLGTKEGVEELDRRLGREKKREDEEVDNDEQRRRDETMWADPE
ncbi:hypothetical protein JCM8547_007879 [Rhodosporidiobolus lusitaniae]